MASSGMVGCETGRRKEAMIGGHVNICRRDLASRNVSVARFHSSMVGLILSLGLADVWAGRLVRLEGFGQFRTSLFGIALLLTIALYCHLRAYERLREAAFICIWMVALTFVLNVFIQLCGRAPSALIDSQLAGLDAALGFSVGRVTAWVRPHRIVRVILLATYSTVPLLMVAAAMIPTLQGKFRPARQYLLAVTIGAVITGALFALWPAIGPWVIYGHNPAPDQLAAQNYLLALKAPGAMTLNLDVAAIVSFPSFHVVLALLSVAALWHHRKARIFLGALCAAICISTLTTGWHYAVDVLGGVAVTPLAYALAGRLLTHVSNGGEQ